ncbi:MAG: DUF4375 domain-containing protein [Thermoanaerobaculia bacterium]|jgi:hypothetical protein
MNEPLARRFGEVVKRAFASGFRDITEPERVWVNTRALIDSVENGGVISYFYNSPADHLSDCMSALAVLELPRIAAAVSRVAAWFPGGVPPTVDGRNEVMDSWPQDEAGDERDARLAAIDHEIEALIPEAEARLQAFLVASGLAT